MFPIKGVVLGKFKAKPSKFLSLGCALKSLMDYVRDRQADRNRQNEKKWVVYYYPVDAVGSSQIFFPTQNLESAY